MSPNTALPVHVARGVSLIVGAMFVTSIQDVIFKLFTSELTFGQIFALRAMLAIPMLFALAWLQGMRRSCLVDAVKPWILLRSIFLTLLFLCFYGAIPFVSLSILGAATYVAPLFVTLLAAYFIGEPVGMRGWIAVLAGFIGVVILLEPGTDAFSPWAVMPLAGALFYALAHIITRAKCQSVPLPAMALSLNFVMLAAGLLMVGVFSVSQPKEALLVAYPYIFGGWMSVGASEWMVLGLLAILTVLIGLGVAGAYQAAPPPTVATFEYCYLVFAAIWDYVFFATSLSIAAIFGVLMIIGAGVTVLRRK